MIKSRSRIDRHAEKLTIRGPVPWLALPQLLKLLPRIFDLKIARGRHKGPEMFGYHPAYPRLTFVVRAARGTSALTKLTLQAQRFSSPGDVLRLLALFPRLAAVDLTSCVIEPNPGLVPVTQVTSLVGIVAYIPTSSLRVCSSLAQWWQWPHLGSTGDLDGAKPFPGVRSADARGIFAVINCLDPFPGVKGKIRSVRSQTIRCVCILILPDLP